MNTPYVELGDPDRTWICAWKEPEVTVSTTDPTEVAVSLVFVVQSPWEGLSVPNATVLPVDGSDVDVDVDPDVEVDVDVGVDVEDVVASGLLEQADTKDNVATRTTATSATGRRGNDARIRAILCRSLRAC